jgi:tetratricopeptide (TPR) repeat protein
MGRIITCIAALLLACAFVSCGGGSRGISTGDPASVVTHKVVPGESWASISEDYYGSDDRAEALADYNGSDPASPPRPGKGIRIPLSPGDLDLLDEKLNAAAIYNEGLDLAMRGDYAGAVERFRAALEKDPDLHEASFNLAVTYQKLGLHPNAETVLEDLVAREPGVAEYYFALGNSRFHQGNFSSAARAFRWALDVDPDHLEALYSLAVSQEKMGDESGAKSTWRRYLELDSTSEWAEEAKARLGALEKKPRQ